MDKVNAQQEAMPLKEINMEAQENKGKFDFLSFLIHQFYLSQIEKDIVQEVRKVLD